MSIDKLFRSGVTNRIYNNVTIKIHIFDILYMSNIVKKGVG